MITPGTNKQPGRQASKQAKKTTTTTTDEMAMQQADPYMYSSNSKQ